MEQLQILWVTHSYCKPGAGVKPHTHPYYHLFYLSNGEIDFTVNQTKYHLVSGDCIIVPRGSNHSFENNGTTADEHIEVKFSLKGPLANSEDYKQTLFAEKNLLVGLLLKRLAREYEELESAADDSARSYLMSVLNVMTEDKRRRRFRAFKYLDADKYSLLSQEIVHYLEEHFSENISLDSLAEALGYNKSYLCVAYKKDTGSTILDSLNIIRIKHAAELIAYSDHDIAYVADACGFSSVNYFNNVFNKYVGTTPGQVRRAFPQDILLSYENGQAKPPANRSERFMYGVLARKRFSYDTFIKNDK